ncbi:PRA1 family protein B4 [Diplonema papillatum]|nr:PRA1 family protein B4 [Diplonema papillatum]
MAMEPEREPLNSTMSNADEEIEMSGSSAQVNNEPGINAFAQQDELAFLNDSGGRSELTTGTPANLLQQMQTHWESAKTLRTSMSSDLAPWTAFVDRSKFSAPAKSEVFGRVRANVKVFYANYGVLLGGLAIFILISNLYFLLGMLISVGSYYYYRLQTSDGSAFVFRGRQVSPSQFYVFLVSFTLFLFWLTGGGSTVFWLVASALSIVLGHASFREVETELVLKVEDDFGAFNQLAQQV